VLQIRVSIYALCLAAGVLKTLIRPLTSTKNYEEFVQSLNSAMQIQGLALLVTAIYQTTKRQLTLFHAICVLHLLSLLGFGLVAQRRYGGGVARWLVLAAMRLLIAAGFIAFTAYIWMTAPTFGSQPECNKSTIYVIFGVSIHATENVFRFVALSLLIILAVSWVFSMLIFALIAYCCCGVSLRSFLGSKERHSDLQVLRSLAKRIKISDPKHRWKVASGQVVDLLIHTGINAYMVVTLEQTINRNRVSMEERAWTFGQVLAIAMLLGVVVEVINIILPKLVGEADGTTPHGTMELRPRRIENSQALAGR